MKNCFPRLKSKKRSENRATTDNSSSRMAFSSNFTSIKKMTTRVFNYMLENPQQHPSLVAYTRYSLPFKYEYARPNFLDLDKEATTASSDHELRPVMHPKRPLIMNAGYAEVINAGKTPNTNEDQANFCSFVVSVPSHLREESWSPEQCLLPCVYFAVFDGHAGTFVNCRNVKLYFLINLCVYF